MAVRQRSMIINVGVILTTAVALLSGQLAFASVWIFLVSALSIIGLAHIIGTYTARLAAKLGSSLGALLGVAFGNSVELILSLFALHDGLYDLVKASIIGGVLANLLLTLGVSMVIGGGATKVQQFNRRKAGLNSAMLFVAVIGLSTASIFSILNFRKSGTESLSIGVAAVFLLVYLGGFLFSFLTHKSFLAGPPVDEQMTPTGKTNTDILVLVLATVAVAFVSDQLVSSIQVVAQQLGLTQQFIGLIFIPLIGIAPEFFAALLLARNGQMEGSIEIAVGSSLQISFFVAPVLVIAGIIMARPITMVFTPAEVIVLFLATLLVNIVSLDGETHWFEGIMVVATYVIFALMFFFA